MSWELKYLPEAAAELRALDGSQRIQVVKAITKVKQNPLPINEGGYGKPLGSHTDNNLTGLLKIKLKALGIRVVYKLIRTDEIMCIIVIGVRADEEVYEIAGKRNAK